MSSLEIVRQSYEDIEIYESAMSAQLDKKPKTTKQLITQHHHISNLLDRIQAQSQLIEKVSIKDEDGTFKEELAQMKGQNAFGSFYNSLKETKDYHLRFPNSEVRHGPSVMSEMACTVEFSGEEMNGKYLDLHSFHEDYLNLKQQFGIKEEHVPYADYLAKFSHFDKVSRQSKNKKYAKYCHELANYLKSFFQRTSPLVSLTDLLEKECFPKFEESWSKGQIPGWETKQDTSNDQSSSNKNRPIDLSSFLCAESLESLGMTRLAEGLSALGLKSGGSLKDRAKRLYSIKGLKEEDFPKQLKAKNKNKQQQQPQQNQQNDGGDEKEESKKDNDQNKRKRDDDIQDEEEDGEKSLARTEAVISYLALEMEDVVDATIKHVEKRHTMMFEERIAEMQEEEFGPEDEDEENNEDEDEDDDKEEGVLYNPLNLPLGWDGKPIPYWLYKLHGLGVEFKCEICGDASYFGRRAFDRHFQEFRHAYGMRALGIPNTKHFHDITLVEDAKALYAKLKANMSGELFDAAAEEEYEDSEGHVLNRRTYEDLARQGLL